MACYDSLFLKNKARCDAKKIVESLDKNALKECYVEAGYTLNKQFCLDFFPDVEINSEKEAQYDARYACFSDIDLVYDQTESIATIDGIQGIPVLKDREYCELLHLSDSTSKYDCISNIAIVNQQTMLDTICAQTTEDDDA